MSAAPVLARTQAAKMLAHDDVFIGLVKDGRLMATNRYWIVEADRLAELWDWWNLPVEQGSYYVNGRVTRTAMPQPDFDKLMVIPKARTTLSPEMVGAHPLMFEDRPGVNVALFKHGDVRLGFNQRYLGFVTGGSERPTLEQETGKPTTPALLRDGSKIVGLLMPVRLS